MENNLYKLLPKMEINRNYKSDVCFYHISINLLEDDVILKPRVPRGMCEENAEIPRICLSRSIEGALKAKFENNWDNYPSYYVYKIPCNGLTIVEPTMLGVPDTYISQELWCLSEIPPELRQLTGIVTNIRMIYQNQDIEGPIFNDTCTFKDYYDEPRYCVRGEMFYDYIPAKIIRSPFIKYDQKYKSEYVEYLENKKTYGIDNPLEYEKERIKYEPNGINRYYPYYNDYE